MPRKSFKSFQEGWSHFDDIYQNIAEESFMNFMALGLRRKQSTLATQPSGHI